MRVRQVMLGATLLAVTAGVAEGQQKPRRDRNVITLEEIQKSSAKNAYEAVRTLRGIWLSSRGSVSLGDIATKEQGIGVYVDGVRRGNGPQELEFVSIEQVKEIRYYPTDQAVAKFGSENPVGAIEVRTRS